MLEDIASNKEYESVKEKWSGRCRLLKSKHRQHLYESKRAIGHYEVDPSNSNGGAGDGNDSNNK